MGFQIGDRLKIGDHICTVKFVGKLPKWPDSNAYGVEWDDPTRGKNSGTFEGQSYFETSKFNSGSFFKDSRLEEIASRGVSFYEAYSEKFRGSAEEFNELRLGSRVIEAPDFEKVENRHRSRNCLERAILDHHAINNSPLSEAQWETMREGCVKVRHLDLSYNLLSDFHQTCVLLTHFDNLESVDLSRNVFTNGWDMLNNFVFPGVRELTMTGNELGIEPLQKIIGCFPNLESLDLSWNHLIELNGKPVSFPSTLKTLGLNGNSMTHVPTSVSGLSLQTLHLSHNLLSDVDPISTPSLRHLDLSFNMIDDWKTLDLLNDRISKLLSLRINNNPISANDKLDSVFHIMVARFEEIEVLDDSILSKKVRNDAELYFVSKVINGEMNYDKKLRRWKTLQEKYSLQTKDERIEKISWLESLIITVRAIDENAKATIKCTLLNNFTVRHSKKIICRKLGLSLFDHKLHLAITPELLQVMSFEFRPISSYGVSENSIIYVKRKPCTQDSLKICS